MIKKWKKDSEEDLGDFRVFSVKKLWNRSPLTNKFTTFMCWTVQIEVNIVAVTSNEEVLLIEQYRHGTDDIMLEIPGGAVEKGENNARLTAQRELQEETGYVSDDWHFLGATHPNPAIQGNRCHMFLANNAQLKGAQNLDTHEDISVSLIPLGDIPRLIQEGKISHTLVITAFTYFHSWKERNPLK